MTPVRTRTRRRAFGVLLLAALTTAACAAGDEVNMRRTVEGQTVQQAVTSAPTATTAPQTTDGDGGQTVTTEVVVVDPGSAGRPGSTTQTTAVAGEVDCNSDRGVTCDEITVGVISVLSGGQRFVGEPPYRTAIAYAEYLNRSGGINGRKVKVIGYDVCISCPEDGLAAAIKAVEEDKVFAILNGFVANASLGPAIEYLSEHETPMIQTAGIPQVDPWVYAFGLHLPYRGAVDADLAKRYLEENNLPKKVALLRFNTPVDAEISKWQKTGLQKLGIEVVAEEAVEYGAGMTNQGSQTARMQEAGAELIVGSHGVVCAFNMSAAGQRDWDVPYLCTILYDQYAQELAGDEMWVRDVLADSDGYATPDMPGPGVQKYNQVMDTFYPGYDVGLLTLYSFLGMQVFDDAVKAQGTNLTRQGVQQFLANLTDYDGGGLTPPFTVTPTDHTAIKGAAMLQLDDSSPYGWRNLSGGFVYPDPIHGLDL